ncbi:hypothetical protein [Streptococcus thoraltensis]|uniref:hypothetical protein n=1 Tax=Streptococcus thoraltensis TaxID=55085 RepID=UPI00037D6AC5|nr:hypothetical protein [Streptococcus thoraltensis]MDY4761591.1 hypothetical protein [Streptococcus thoraltensis]
MLREKGKRALIILSLAIVINAILSCIFKMSLIRFSFLTIVIAFAYLIVFLYGLGCDRPLLSWQDSFARYKKVMIVKRRVLFAFIGSFLFVMAFGSEPYNVYFFLNVFAFNFLMLFLLCLLNVDLSIDMTDSN